MTTATETGASAVPPSAPVVSAQRPRDVRQAGQQLESVLIDAADETEATDRFLQLSCQLIGARGALYFPATADGRISKEPEVRSPAGIGGNLVDQLHPLLRVAQAERTIQLARADHEGTQVVFVVPVMRTGRATECFVAIVPVPLDANERLAAVCLTLQCLAAFVGQWRGRFQELSPTSEVAAWRQFCDGIREAAGAEQMAAAAEPLAAAMAALTGAHCVALGVRRHASSGRILAVAPGGHFDPGAELAQCFESVLSETMLESPTSSDCPAPAIACRDTDSTGRLRELTNREFVWQVPLSGASGEAIGGCILIFDSTPSTGQVAALEFAASLIGPQWDLVNRSGRARVGWRQRWRQTRERLSTRTRVALTVAALGLALAFFAVPLPYRLKCPCEVQPVTRRYVVAPYEGRLESALVEPGDEVSAGQILARMDAAEIRMEMAGLQADLQRATKQRDSSLASRETAAAQIATLEMERLQLRIDLLQDRMDHLDIRSPTDGVIISGDPRKLQGARMTIGQTLAEVGPLEGMVLEVAIRDEDIACARVGSPVRVRLESMAFQSLRGTLTRIQPRSEQRDGRNVFVGHVDLLPDQELLRPGMRGRAKIEAPRHSLFWILFHRTWEHLLLRFG